MWANLLMRNSKEKESLFMEMDLYMRVFNKRFARISFF